MAALKYEHLHVGEYDNDRAATTPKMKAFMELEEMLVPVSQDLDYDEADEEGLDYDMADEASDYDGEGSDYDIAEEASGYDEEDTDYGMAEEDGVLPVNAES